MTQTSNSFKGMKCFKCGATDHIGSDCKDEDITPCQKCNCMTKSIRIGRANYKCGKCGHDKSLSDVYFYEATHKKDGTEVKTK